MLLSGTYKTFCGAMSKTIQLHTNDLCRWIPTQLHIGIVKVPPANTGTELGALQHLGLRSNLLQSYFIFNRLKKG